jgi:predicted dehydrogenase
MKPTTRRHFLHTTGCATAALPLLGGLVLSRGGRATEAGANAKVRVGLIGCGGMGKGDLATFFLQPEVECPVVCDVDDARLAEAVKLVEEQRRTTPAVVKDFRRVLERQDVDAVIVATPDHWHALPTVLACQAGKDVYVEKPDGHDIVEGQRMVAAQRKHARVVQMGSQHRATRRMQTALEYLRTGALGRCLVAKAWESTKQRSIGRPADGTAPPEVDYDFWLGGAPLRPFNPARFHGNWRWFHDYGTGDLGNDGVHRMDMAYAALVAAAEGVGESVPALPERISAAGGKWYFDDAQEFPDTLQVNYEYGAAPARSVTKYKVVGGERQPFEEKTAGASPKLLTYEMRIWAPYDFHGESEGAAVYGEKGYMVLGNSRWRAFGPKNEVLREETGDSSEVPHVRNFLECLKTRARPYCDLETVGHPASLLSHAGNIAARVGRTLRLDAKTETFVDDPEANALRGRPEYRAPWLLPSV